MCFMEACLIYKVVQIPTVQQSDSVTHVHAFFSIYFFIVVYHRILNRVPCAIGPCCLSSLYIIVFIC